MVCLQLLLGAKGIFSTRFGEAGGRGGVIWHRAYRSTVPAPTNMWNGTARKADERQHSRVKIVHMSEREWIEAKEKEHLR
jgi:hypothetical protein